MGNIGNDFMDLVMEAIEPSKETGMEKGRRKVVIEFCVKMVVNVADDADEEFVNFHYNKSSYCACNVVQQLAHEMKRYENKDDACFCHRSHAKYLRDATSDDIEVFTVTGD